MTLGAAERHVTLRGPASDYPMTIDYFVSGRIVWTVHAMSACTVRVPDLSTAEGPVLMRATFHNNGDVWVIE